MAGASALRPGDPARGHRQRLPLLLSIVALVAALVAMVLSWRAADQASVARDIALARPAAPADPTGPAPPTAPAPTVEPGSGASAGDPPPDATDLPTATASTDIDPTSSEPPPLNPDAVYKIKYDKQILTLKASCSNSMYADLDEPRANVDSPLSDLALEGGCTTNRSSALTFGEGVQGSDAGAPNMTPKDCAEKIRTAPLGDGATVPVRKGIVLCLSTSYTAARERGDPQRLVLIEVTGVAVDNAVTLQVTAWNVPR